MDDTDTVADWAGLKLDRPRVMGILNVTPDSFSDGNRFATTDVAVAAGLKLAAGGADIIDVGGESTRPGAAPVSPAQEQGRTIPVVRALAAAGLCVSIDTRNAATMRAALDVGARIVNDVSALTHDPAAASLVAARGCAVVLMHMRGTPADMTARAVYVDLVAEVADELTGRMTAARAAGIAPAAIALDPGIGFAKRAEHSIGLLRALPTLARLGRPIVLGVSRKSFIGHLSQQADPAQRLPGSLAAALYGVAQGASIIRVHDVLETVQAIKVWHSLAN